MWLAIESIRARAQALIQTKVPVVEMNINAPLPLRVVAFPKEEVGRVMEILGLSLTPELGTETDQEGVWFLKVGEDGPPSSATVKVADWNGNNRGSFIKAAQEILVPVVGDVILTVPHGGAVAPASDGKFHIFIWSTPASQKNKKPPATIWGFPVDCQDKGFLPSGQGVPIIDPETGWSVAELVGNANLYIHHDLCHHGTDREIQIFRRLCEEVVAELTLSPEKKSEKQKEIAERERQRSREAYVKECGRRIQKAFEETQKSLQDSVRQHEEYSKGLTEAIRAETNLRRTLEQLGEAWNNQALQFGQEFDRLLAVSKVKTVKVEDGKISVFTEHLYTNRLKKDGTIRELGEYRIDIPTSGGSPKFYNLTRQIDKYHHPHQQDDGYPCLGNIKEGIAKLAGAYEYSVVAQIMIQFLESIDEEDSYGKRVYNWPVKSKEVTNE
jgi:hypothetical protein